MRYLVERLNHLFFTPSLYAIKNKLQHALKSIICDLKKLLILYSVLGGHTFEMLHLIRNIQEAIRPRVYVVADTDILSEKKAIMLEESRKSRASFYSCSYWFKQLSDFCPGSQGRHYTLTKNKSTFFKIGVRVGKTPFFYSRKKPNPLVSFSGFLSFFYYLFLFIFVVFCVFCNRMKCS